MNKEIQDAFIDGINEVYSIMFTDGVNDGIKLYLLDPTTTGGFYKEQKVKRYKKPVLMVAKAQLNLVPKSDETAERDYKDNPKFVVPLKSFIQNEVACNTEQDLDVLRKGYIEFHDNFYEIQNVKPGTFLEDVFMTYTFECVHDLKVKSLLVVEEPEPEEPPVESGGDEVVTET